jgi:hypothetical protein
LLNFIESFHQKEYCVEVFSRGALCQARITATVEQQPTGPAYPLPETHHGNASLSSGLKAGRKN